jgi:hypothetical protein
LAGRIAPFADAQVTMTLAIRFLPNPGRKVIYGAGGRAYPSTGATVDIPFPDAETIQSGQATRLMIIGTTADRPVNVPAVSTGRRGKCTTQRWAPPASWFPAGTLSDG